MSDKPADYGREVRDTVVKSSLTGVAATVLAVTVFSPAGFGGVIGESLASNFGNEANAASADDPYANLPPFPAPLSAQEIDNIRSQLARTTASLEITRAATEDRIEHIRSIALSGDAVTFAPVQQQVARVGEGLRLRTSEVEPIVAPAPTPATAEAAPEAAIMPVSYIVGEPIEYRDSPLELAELFLAHAK
jgi:hypothetical protein